MQVFKTFFKLLKSQMTAIIMYGAGFLAMTIIIASSLIGKENGDFAAKKTPIMVINEDGENSFIEGFLSYLDLYVEYVDIENNENSKKDALFFGKIFYILTIPKGFSEDFLNGKQVSLTKELIPNIPETMSVDRAIDNYLNKARLYLSYIPELETEDLYSYINENLGNESVVYFDVNKNSDEVSANEYNRNYFNYLGYIILGCFITGVSTVMLSFHNKEIRKRQNASPMSTRNMNIQLILANMVFVLVYLSIFIVAGYITNPYRMINHNGILFIINSVIYTLTALSISYLIGITVVSKNAVSALSTVVSLGFAFLSGVFVPQELLGKAVQKVSSFTPTYWYVKANDSIATLNELNWDNGVGIFTDMAIELGFALVIFSIILVVNKGKRQQA